jgi:hypothetical protein
MEGLVANLILGGLGVVVSIFGYMIKKDLDRLDHIEKRLENLVTEEKCIRLIMFHIDPIHDNIKRIDTKIDRFEGKIDQILFTVNK